jgi:uncharacterized protein (TIGR00251 family)
MCLLGLKIKSAAKENILNGFVTIENKDYLKLSIKAAPDKGRANEEIIKFLASKLGLRQKDLEIISGHTHSLKVISIDNMSKEEVMEKLKT